MGVDAPLTEAVSLYSSAFYDHSIEGGQSWSAGDGRIGIKVEFRVPPFSGLLALTMSAMSPFDRC